MKAQPEIAKLAEPQKHAGVETVAAILKRKGTGVWSIPPDAMVYDAIAMMAEKGIGALVILSEGELIGIVSERDYARKVILQGRASRETAVSEIMSSPVIAAKPEDTVDHCLRLMIANRIRHLPVIDTGRVSGMVSIGDLVVSTLSMQAHTIDQLETYIANRYPK
ncbi:MAG TPA: CBS domain-containing protein [Bryobacteraceae bacterium]